jgi:lia operon protein LiaG
MLMLLAALSALMLQQTPRQTLKGDSVAIYNLVGELRVEPGSGSDVVVEITRGGADADKLELQTGDVRGRASLRVVYPADVIILSDRNRGWQTTLRVRDDGTFNDDSWNGHRFRDGREVRIGGRGRRGNDGLEAFADLRVLVPRGKNVALYLGVGKAVVSNVDGTILVRVASADVAAERTRGTLKVATGSGNVDLREATGDVSLNTGSGDITAAAVQATRLSLETGSGNVTLTDGKATSLSVETGSGDVDVTGAGGDELSFDTGSGNIDIALSTTFSSLTVETGSGDVTLKMPPATSAQVDIDTGSGDIDLGGFTLAVRRIERDHVTGTLGDGRGRLSVETGSGNVRLLKL